MIVPMKKLAIIVQAKDAAPAIKRLCGLGVVHVEHQKAPAGSDVSTLKDEIALINTTIGILSQPEFSEKFPSSHKEVPGDWKAIVQHIIDLRDRFNQLKEYAMALTNRITQWGPWGDFDPERVQFLSEKGVYIRFYRVPVKEANKFPAGCVVKKISITGGVANCAVISRSKVEIPFTEVALPKMSLSKTRVRLAADKRTMQSIKEDIQNHIRYRASLLRIRQQHQQELEFHEALTGMGQAGEIMYLTGYIPCDAAEAVQKASEKEKWGMLISEPSDEDNVPTLIRNPRWVSLIKPVFKVIEVIPGYRELDISLWFLLFFSVFFGMLIGDAAYGLIFFGLTLLAQRKWGKRLADQSIFVLFYILSSCAIIWGVLSGTFFGQEWLPAFVKPLIPALRNNKNIITLCFLIGAVHLSIAHLWRALVKLPSRIALSEVGWISILWGAFLLARTLVLGDSFPLFGKWLLITGATFVIFFTSAKRNIVKDISAGLGSLLLDLVNSFAHIVSYIRLFAMGLATVAIADAFNNMAMNVGYNGIVAGVLTSLILLVGHGLNILLGPMSLLVHGLRLNMLEFSNHANVTWSGFAYKPLKEE